MGCGGGGASRYRGVGIDGHSSSGGDGGQSSGDGGGGVSWGVSDSDYRNNWIGGGVDALEVGDAEVTEKGSGS